MIPVIQLTKLRKELHQHPELSGDEKATAKRIVEELERCNPDNILQGVGGAGVLAVFASTSGSAKKTILFRAELDAIAVHEENEVPHRSEIAGVMHGCGHDGHMAILLGFARYLEQNPPENTDVLLLFQPAEETGEGAARVLADKRFHSLEIDHAFALHNLPGFEQNSIVIKNSVFASASVGIEIQFKGKSSHAAYPEHGSNPSLEMAGFIKKADKALYDFKNENSLNKAVTTFISLGKPAYGISPGTGKIRFTLRSSDDESLEQAVNILQALSVSAAESFSGLVEWRLAEPFAATVNSDQGCEAVRASAQLMELNIEELSEPFPWSEDFGEFRKTCPVTLFGLGAGENTPPLHSEQYDFNDNLIETGICMFAGILQEFGTEDEP